MLRTADPERCKWDVIVVGTGMGGASIGYALAKAGKRVLFCERGMSHLNGKLALRGEFAESFFPHPEVPQPKHREILARAGRSTDEIKDTSIDHTRRFIPFTGQGTGGSTSLYGMALERFFPSDFTPRRNYPQAGEATLPESWPITYEELHPYYEAAERLFRVRGTADPLRGNESFDHLLPPSPLSPASEELYDFLSGKGLHPYRSPIACEYVSGCECCQGYLCDKDCKNDSARICLEPALSKFGARLLDECEVLKLEATRSEVTGVICSWRGRQLTLRAAVVVLAAGVLETPRVLLNSASPAWPNGLTNDSGLVGRNLMRHYVDLYAILPKTREKNPVNFKELAFNDFYMDGKQKFGTVQSFGTLPPASVLVEGIEHELREGRLPQTALLFRLVKPIVRYFLAQLLSRSIMLATIVEDLPYRDNLVTLSDQTDNLGRRGLILKYEIHEHDRKRIKAFRRQLRKIFKPYHFILIKQAENNERAAHDCGTCRFGSDPEDSVLDANNRAHGLSNLYVVDSSFFPSSGGSNPGLTIAANALRVADHLLGAKNRSLDSKSTNQPGMLPCTCRICGYQPHTVHACDLGTVRGNTERFRKTLYRLWKCPKCNTIHNIDPVDFHSIYSDYPLNKRRIDIFARCTLLNLLKRLKHAGLKKNDSILDYGCGNGIFIQFLKNKGYTDVSGYDPYVPEFASLPGQVQFDCVVANDVIEHASDPCSLVQDCVTILKPGGLFYIGTADARGVEMSNLEPHIMRLHQPFHRVIITQDSLKKLCSKAGLKPLQAYRRSYMDTLIPFANYRFLDEFNKALGHNMDRALDPAAGRMLFRQPKLLFYGLFGYFCPSAYEPAVVARKPE